MRFREVVLQARDPDPLAAWYRGTLGLAPAPGRPVGVIAGATTLRFERAPPGTDPVHHFAFNVPENRIEDAVRWIGDRAALIPGEEGPIVVYDAWDAHAVYFTDPAGNIGELIARHALANAREGVFDGSMLLEVSEVGLPCPDVRALAAELKDALRIPEYRPLHDGFAALGDERGLLILVREGRAWFPTHAAARPFPTGIAHDGPAHATRGLPYRIERAR